MRMPTPLARALTLPRPAYLRRGCAYVYGSYRATVSASSQFVDGPTRNMHRFYRAFLNRGGSEICTARINGISA